MDGWVLHPSASHTYMDPHIQRALLSSMLWHTSTPVHPPTCIPSMFGAGDNGDELGPISAAAQQSRERRGGACGRRVDVCSGGQSKRERGGGGLKIKHVQFHGTIRWGD